MDKKQQSILTQKGRNQQPKGGDERTPTQGITYKSSANPKEARIMHTTRSFATTMTPPRSIILYRSISTNNKHLLTSH